MVLLRRCSHADRRPGCPSDGQAHQVRDLSTRRLGRTDQLAICTGEQGLATAGVSTVLGRLAALASEPCGRHCKPGGLHKRTGSVRAGATVIQDRNRHQDRHNHGGGHRIAATAHGVPPGAPGTRPPPKLMRRDRRAAPRRRHPIMAAPKKPVATRTKATAVPWPEITLKAMPSATVESKTTRPPKTDAPSRRRPDAARQPAIKPKRNGYALDASPVTLIPWEWTARPIPTKTRTATASAATAGERIRRKANGNRPDPAAAWLRATQCERRRATRDWLW